MDKETEFRCFMLQREVCMISPRLLRGVHFAPVVLTTCILHYAIIMNQRCTLTCRSTPISSLLRARRCDDDAATRVGGSGWDGDDGESRHGGQARLKPQQLITTLSRSWRKTHIGTK
jgi:hypothetical protein